MSKYILVGGAWPYANNSLHVGHLAALLPGDIIARFYRKKGDNVLYVSGSDCHGSAITVHAEKQHLTPQEIATKYDLEFNKNFKDLDFSYDLYTATMQNEHKTRVKDYWTRIKNNGYIYEQIVNNYYCPNCKKIIVDREVVGRCPNCHSNSNGEQCDVCLNVIKVGELENACCKACGTKAETVSGKHLFFKLSAFTDMLDKYVNETSTKYNWRNTATQESLKYTKLGLKDRVITRDIDWGIELPFEGFEDKRLYVWFDAVLGYMTAGDIVSKEKYNTDIFSILTNPDTLSYYNHGKDNIFFHTIILPALMDAIDPNLIKPQHIVSCEYVNINNEKMSKSKGNSITINDLLSKFCSDSIRYYFIKNNPETKDISISYDDMIECHNKQIVGGYGNFVNRNLSFLKKKYDSKLPNCEISEDIKQEVIKWYADCDKKLVNAELRSFVDYFYGCVQFANTYFDKNEPWKLINENINQFEQVISNCLYIISNLANLSSILMPKTADRIAQWLQLDLSKWEPITYNAKIVPEIDILFNRIDKEEFYKN